jgi:MOSC domain-containing protein YiiM
MIKVLSVNVGAVQAMEIAGRRVMTGMHKHPVSGPVACQALGLAGDEQADLTVHGGLSKAIYAYPSEHFAFWRTVRAQARVAAWDAEVPAGLMGENLTLAGVTERQLWIGDRWHLPSGCTLVVSEPRRPCYKFNEAMGFAKASKLMVESGFCGTYLAVLTPGDIQAGDELTLEPGPRELSLADLFRSRTAGRHFS